jgi:multiple sugar transport system substrate-binding protein
MGKITLSLCVGHSVASDYFSSLTTPFEKLRNSQISTHLMPWDSYKQELTAIALHGRGVDVSQVGGPLVNDLVAMNGLRPFSEQEIDAMGGMSAFSTTAWMSSKKQAGKQTWAIPWVVDPRAIFYWRDLFEKAGVDESTAFSSFAKMEDTMQRLQKTGIETPWAIPLSERLAAFQDALTWIWGAGGDIGDEESILFHQPQSVNGLENYFRLYRYMPKEGQPLDFSSVENLFKDRRIAVTMGNIPPFNRIREMVGPDLASRIGVALPPGPLFIGNSDLVIWKNTTDERTAVNLVNYLVGEEAQMEFCRLTSYFPARKSLLSQPPYSDDPRLRVFAQSALQGRTMVSVRLGGLIEDMLSLAIQRIWNKVITIPDLDIRSAILEVFDPLVRRLSFFG